MLLYTKRCAPKEPKKRSRAGCIRCKQKKKKCNEERPECHRCIENGVTCEYEIRKTRKRDRISFSGSALSEDGNDHIRQQEKWEQEDQQDNDGSAGGCTGSDTECLGRKLAFGDDQYVEGLVEHTGTVVRLRSRSPARHPPDLAMIAPSPVASPLREFSAPAYMEFSEKTNRRVLVDHFCNVLSHLIVFKEDTGNPFRQLVLPLSNSCPAVMDAIYALSSAHLEYRGVRNEEMSLTFHNRALKGIAQLIEQDDPSKREELLGAIMLLVYHEVLVQQGNSNIVQGHLKGALAIMNTSSEIVSPTSIFLERAFRFYDVVAALSLGAAPSTDSQTRTTPFHFSTSSANQDSLLGNVDVLLGLSTDLWPIIHRLSNLLSMKNSLDEAVAAGQISKAFVLQSELENTSQAIELALTRWAPSAFDSAAETKQPDFSNASSEIEPETGTGTLNFLNEASEIDDIVSGSAQSAAGLDLREQARIQSILCNAEAYRHSALVYLYRIIRCLPYDATQVQRHVRLSLSACSGVVASAEQCSGFNGPMAALLWPLFVAACEAITDDDRTMSQQAFFGSERRQGMRNIKRSWEVVQEVWRRRDCGQLDVDWRDVCKEQGINIVFG